VLLREVEYASPSSVDEVIRLLRENDGARALAGGQTLINVMKARAASPDVLVDLNGLDELRGIELGADGTCIVNAAASIENGGPRVAIGCVDAVPVLVEPSSADESAVRDAVRSASFEPPSDVHGSASYRRHLAEVLAVRAVQTAAERS